MSDMALRAYRALEQALRANDSIAAVLRAGQVFAFGVGRKVSGGVERDELVLRFHVRKKRALHALTRRARIPAVFERALTDVIQSAVPRAHAFDPRAKSSPLSPGVSIAGAGGTTGTLGALVVDAANHKLLLTAAHVAQSFDANNRAVFQPSFIDHAWPDAIAKVRSMHPDPWPSPEVDIDAAVAELAAGAASSPIIPVIGSLSGARDADATVGLSLEKYGRTTRHTTGVVKEFPHSTTMDVLYAGSPMAVFYRDQLLLSSASGSLLCDEGDSGALWVDSQTKQAVGLHCGGSAAHNTAIATPIARVLTRLGVTLA